MLLQCVIPTGWRVTETNKTKENYKKNYKNQKQQKMQKIITKTWNWMKVAGDGGMEIWWKAAKILALEKMS